VARELRFLNLLAVALLAPAIATFPAERVAAVGCEGALVVVVHPHGGKQSDCVSDPAGRTAAQLFEDAGHRLTRVQRFPGAVCRVDGVPSDQGCVAMPPVDAYWGFFETVEGSWVYATVGVDSVTPESGDGVALVWQDSADPVPPPHTLATASAASTGADKHSGFQGQSDDAGSGGLPAWIAVAGAAVLLTMAVAAHRRRRE
jgi:hypothetical protein